MKNKINNLRRGLLGFEDFKEKKPQPSVIQEEEEEKKEPGLASGAQQYSDADVEDATGGCPNMNNSENSVTVKEEEEKKSNSSFSSNNDKVI